MKRLSLVVVLVSILAVVTSCSSNADLSDIEHSTGGTEHPGMIISSVDKEKVYSYVDDLLPYIEEVELANVMVGDINSQINTEKISMDEAKLMYEEVSDLYKHSQYGLGAISLPVLENPELDRLVQDIHVLFIRVTDEGELITIHMLQSMDTYDMKGLNKAKAHAETLSRYMDLLNTMFDTLYFKLELDVDQMDLT